MRIAHPRTLSEDAGPPPANVDVRGETISVDDDGVFETDDRAWLESFASRYDAGPEDLIVDGAASSDDAEEDEAADDGEICGYEKDDGEICERTAGWGRDADAGPCKDHVDTEG